MSTKKENVAEVKDATQTVEGTTQVLEQPNPPVVKTGKLVDPEKVVLMGEVESLVFKLANSDSGGKLSKDTYIASLSVPKLVNGDVEFTQQTVYLTAAQYKEYGMKDILFKGNFVKMMIEKCIENKTGYKEDPEDTFLTPHEKTFDAFHNATEATTTSLYISLTKLGLPKEIVDSIVQTVNQIRETQKVVSAGAKAPF